MNAEAESLITTGDARVGAPPADVPREEVPVLDAADEQGLELVFGLVTPIGTRTGDLAANLQGCLSDYNYRSKVIKVSSLLPESNKVPGVESEGHRVRRLIEAGDDFCRAHKSEYCPDGDPAATAYLVVKAIRDTRVEVHRDSGREGSAPELAARSVPRMAYIIHSLKRPEEIDFLRELYEDRFILVGSQDPESVRLENLMARPLGAADDETKREIAQELIHLDAQEKDPIGQQVNNAYPKADFFMKGTDPRRLVRLLFGEAIAPEVGEYAMYVARASEARSLAASRKVGAALVVGESVVSSGYNDAPDGHASDIVRGEDTSEKLKRENVLDTLDRLRGAGLLDCEPEAPLTEEQVSAAMAALKGGGLLSIIEYQRAVHAEARTIDDATVRGVSTVGGLLYVTTFPCHLCYKHALSVKIDKVFYIEPYPKSRAREMYPFEVDKRLLPYEGVAPRRYIEIFDRRAPFEASSDATFPEVDRRVALPLVQDVGQNDDLPELERIASHKLKAEFR